MTDKDYSKREIDNHFDDIKAWLARQDLKLEEINMRAKTTNGSVADLYKRYWIIAGGSAVILFLLTAIIIPIVLKLL